MQQVYQQVGNFFFWIFLCFIVSVLVAAILANWIRTDRIKYRKRLSKDNLENYYKEIESKKP